MNYEDLKRFQSDFPLFARTCLRIRNKAGKVVPFVLNAVQRYLWRLVKEDLEAGVPVRHIVLKYRQGGISTFYLGLQCWLMICFSSKRCLAMAHEEDSSKNLLNIFRFFKNNLPAEVKPKTRLDNRSEIWFDQLDSRIIIDTARNSNAGKSFTFSFLHVSEIGSWEAAGVDPAKTWESLAQALPDLPGTFGVLESTAEELGDFFESLYGDEDNGYRKIFIPYYADPSYKIEGAEPFELSESESSLYGNEAEEFERLLRGLPQWCGDIKDLEQECFARLAWRRDCIVRKCSRELARFNRNYPSEPSDAFSVAGGHVFNQTILKQMKDRAPKPVYWAVSDEYNKIVRECRLTGNRGFEKVGRDFGKYIEQSIGGGLVVHQLPDDKYNYVIGADVAEGLPNGDYSAFVVLKLSESKLIEAASFNAHIHPIDFAYLLYAVAYWYGTALLGVEINEKGASAVINHLHRELMYPNLYYQENFQTANYREIHDRYGWNTNSYTKGVIIEGLKDAVDYQIIYFYTRECIEQLLKYKRWISPQSKSLKTGVQSGHDDLASAALVARQMARAWHERKEFQPRNIPRNSWEDVMRHGENEALKDFEAKFIL